jgi:hypothetical protein
MILILFVACRAFAQSDYIFTKAWVNIDLPINIHHDKSIQNVSDTQYNEVYSMVYYTYGFQSFNKVSGKYENNVSILFLNVFNTGKFPDNTINDTISISFSIDTIQLILKDVNFRFSYHSTSGFYSSFLESKEVYFSSLPYKINGDTLFTSISGSECRDNAIANYRYYSYELTAPRSENAQIESKNSISISDTLPCLFFLSCLLSAPKNDVNSFKCSQIFSIYTNLSDHNINFTFPSSGGPQQLTLYDILAREISRIEIPSGTTQYTLSTAGYPKGDYFARLGNSTGHFVVY